MHKIRDSPCCRCAYLDACVTAGSQQKGACELKSFAPFGALDQPLAWRSALAMWECVPFSSGSPALPAYPLPHPQDGIDSTCTHIHRIAVLCSLQGVHTPDLPETNKSPCAWKYSKPQKGGKFPLLRWSDSIIQFLLSYILLGRQLLMWSPLSLRYLVYSLFSFILFM